MSGKVRDYHLNPLHARGGHKAVAGVLIKILD
jgi:hypothetical protein